MKRAIIHMKGTEAEKVDDMGLNWDYSQKLGLEEIDVVVDDVEFKSNEDHDELLVDYYLLDPTQVNSISYEVVKSEG